MHNKNVTTKQKIYSEITGTLQDGCTYNNFDYRYKACGKDKLKKTDLIKTIAKEIKVTISESEARQIINAVENKKHFLTFKGIFNSLGITKVNYFDA